MKYSTLQQFVIPSQPQFSNFNIPQQSSLAGSASQVKPVPKGSIFAKAKVPAKVSVTHQKTPCDQSYNGFASNSDCVSQTTGSTADSVSHLSSRSKQAQALAAAQATLRFEQMMEFKRANEDRLQDKFEQLLLTRASEEENPVKISSLNPLSESIAPNLLYKATDIVIPCEFSDEEPDSPRSPNQTISSGEQQPQCDLQESTTGSRKVESDSESLFSAIETHCDTTVEEKVETGSYEKLVMQTVAKLQSAEQESLTQPITKGAAGEPQRLSVFERLQHGQYNYFGSIFSQHQTTASPKTTELLSESMKTV